MPDWLTHVIIGWGIFNLLTIRWKNIQQFKSAVIVGSILPDLWNIRLILEQIGLDLTWQLYVFHTPLGALLTALLISLIFFKEDVWSQGAFFLAIGVGLHLALDLTLRHIGGGHYVLFPISWQLYELGIFWPETFTPLFLAVIFGTASYIFTKHVKENKGTNYTNKIG